MQTEHENISFEQVPAPQLPRPEALQDPMFTKVSACRDWLLCYDPHVRAGSCYQRSKARWITYSNVDVHTWIIALDAMHLRPFDVPEDDFEELVAEAMVRYANRH